MSKRVPQNTKKAPKTALCAFVKSVMNLHSNTEKNNTEVMANNSGSRDLSDAEHLSEQDILEMKYIVLEGSDAEIPFLVEQERRINYFLYEIVFQYRKKNGEEIHPTTMKGYILSLQRAI